MRRLLLTLCLVVPAYHGEAASLPQRVVSLDYCADQYVLRFVGPERIRALSPDAGRSFSYMRDAAQDLPQVRPLAENVIALQPDLVVRSYGGGARAPAFFAALDIPVLQLPYAGSLADIRATILTVAARLGAAGEGERVAARMDARLADLGED